ncbi:hypothetical protein B9Z55_024887 [Caenorhabditis nigoni]|uniref:Uncharacterized protein n=1 Tax=Caenorhabditis nigoni TaxID=1611254 RepID=A0A2G5SVX6_9PELO|nr:hypothetical protein B9Z55_024887 [Caenorhabditis nigoni]
MDSNSQSPLSKLGLNRNVIQELAIPPTNANMGIRRSLSSERDSNSSTPLQESHNGNSATHVQNSVVNGNTRETMSSLLSNVPHPIPASMEREIKLKINRELSEDGKRAQMRLAQRTPSIDRFAQRRLSRTSSDEEDTSARIRDYVLNMNNPLLPFTQCLLDPESSETLSSPSFFASSNRMSLKTNTAIDSNNQQASTSSCWLKEHNGSRINGNGINSGYSVSPKEQAAESTIKRKDGERVPSNRHVVPGNVGFAGFSPTSSMSAAGTLESMAEYASSLQKSADSQLSNSAGISGPKATSHMLSLGGSPHFTPVTMRRVVPAPREESNIPSRQISMIPSPVSPQMRVPNGTSGPYQGARRAPPFRRPQMYSFNGNPSALVLKRPAQFSTPESSGPPAKLITLNNAVPAVPQNPRIVRKYAIVRNQENKIVALKQPTTSTPVSCSYKIVQNGRVTGAHNGTFKLAQQQPNHVVRMNNNTFAVRIVRDNHQNSPTKAPSTTTLKSTSQLFIWSSEQNTFFAIFEGYSGVNAKQRHERRHKFEKLVRMFHVRQANVSSY